MLHNQRNTYFRIRDALQLHMNLHCRWIISAAAAQTQDVPDKNLRNILYINDNQGNKCYIYKHTNTC